MKPYSTEFRGEVLAACDANEGTHDIAVRFKVSESDTHRKIQPFSQPSKDLKLRLV